MFGDLAGMMGKLKELNKKLKKQKID